ncbi:MAG: LL-diaminopimelate aminotransferase [Deferribacteraceae bacterium]|jgi:LL-diaminopimelate aminotransferase|nr:LL-diaminopimelate aminotransferase [Deferribacteraceae bacterium]
MINTNFSKISENYLFSDIAKKVAVYLEKNKGADIIRLGIGDVTLPLTSCAIKAMHEAVDELACSATFRGYGPEQGYPFLTEAIVDAEYKGLGITSDEIFVSDGAKCDVGNFQELFDRSVKAAITDPVYPVYLDSNIMAGRAVAFMPSVEENGFSPDFPKERADLIYLCCPNNPTGAVLTRERLREWVDYAAAHRSIILYDGAYTAFITDSNVPKSIYEIEGARDVAVEFRSFSKTAGFTGARCAYAVVPKTILVDGVQLNKLWLRRQSTKFNGASYIIQRGAAATLTEEGKKETAALVGCYRLNAQTILDGLTSAGWTVYGGKNAPYIWWKIPKSVKSMDFFDILLEKCQVVGTPGSGFGACGEGYFRLTAFGEHKRTEIAIQRIKESSLL